MTYTEKQRRRNFRPGFKGKSRNEDNNSFEKPKCQEEPESQDPVEDP